MDFDTRLRLRQHPELGPYACIEIGSLPHDHPMKESERKTKIDSKFAFLFTAQIGHKFPTGKEVRVFRVNHSGDLMTCDRCLKHHTSCAYTKYTSAISEEGAVGMKLSAKAIKTNKEKPKEKR